MAGGFAQYLKRAFFYHWNLLAVGAGTVLGIISGRPDVVIPALAAGEILYLAVLSTNKRFQNLVDGEHLVAKQQNAGDAVNQKAQQILSSLRMEDRRQYENLKSLCLELRRISKGVKVDTDQDLGSMDDMQAGSINRLLWIYLKLLYSKTALERFFTTIDEKEIQGNIEKTKRRIAELPQEGQDSPMDAKRRATLSDTLATSEQRLQNYKRAVENHDLIKLELERLNTKIAGLSEMSINRQDPNAITIEVDSVASSVQQTEKAMGELEFITGISSQEEGSPSLLESDRITVKAPPLRTR